MYYGGFDEYVEETTTSTTTTDDDGGASETDYLLKRIGALLEASFNITLYRMQMAMDEMETRQEKGDEVAKGVDVNAYRAACAEQLAYVKRILGRR